MLLSRVECVPYKKGLDWMIGFVAPYTFTQFGTTDNTALSLFYTLIFTSRVLATNLSVSP
jgi:hypothetical protein